MCVWRERYSSTDSVQHLQLCKSFFAPFSLAQRELCRLVGGRCDNESPTNCHTAHQRSVFEFLFVCFHKSQKLAGLAIVVVACYLMIKCLMCACVCACELMYLLFGQSSLRALSFSLSLPLSFVS